MKHPVFTNAVICRIKKMQDNGSTNKEIAAAVGTTEGSVRSRSSQLGLARPQDKRCRVHFSQWIIDRCTPHAARRDIPPTELIKLLIERIVNDDLFEAILDDGE